MQNRNQLYWQCRRGMRELDILLQGFLDKRYDGLSSSDKDIFKNLLDYPDHLLLEYLMGRLPPQDRAIAGIVAEIRNAGSD